MQHQESTFTVLSPADCDAQAKQEVQAVCELLCCDADAAHILLRHFRWDRDKLTDGAPRCLRSLAPLRRRVRALTVRASPCLCARAQRT